jgi:hypothetical protein
MSGARERLNKIVGQQPGGGLVLDTLTLFRSIHHRETGPAKAVAQLALDRLDVIAHEMREAAHQEVRASRAKE